MRRSTWIALLVSANLFLLTGLLLTAYTPPAAYAQGTGLAGNYLMVAGEIQDQLDALYVIDLRARTLHAFYYDKSNKKLSYSDFRYLERDFRNNR
jgi:hypothetical protein